MSRFSALHPVVSALYFVSVLIITMFAANPVLLFIALLGGVLFFVRSQRNIRFFKEFRFYLLLFLLVSLGNPLVSHSGVTPLFFLNGNPITLEALLYGVDVAVMLIAVVYWFKCLDLVMTEDKVLFLFGKFSPKIALLVSSALRFIPLLKTQATKIQRSQKAMGLYASNAWSDKLKGTVRVYSALITWALEHAIDTGAAMKARGYGLKGRSHYSMFSFRRSDAWFLVAIAVLDTVVITVMATGGLGFTFYPDISAAPITAYSLSAIVAFAILSLLPFVFEEKEGLQWRYYRSKI